MIRGAPLALKLALAFATIVLLAVGTVAVIVNISVGQRFQDYVATGMRPGMMALVPNLEGYYAEHGSWNGVAAVLSQAAPGLGRGRGMGMMAGTGMPLILTDAQGYVVADTTGLYRNERFGASVLRRGQALQEGGQTVGYLLSADGPAEQAFRDNLNVSLLWAGALASVVAILLGLLLTRTLIRPLQIVRNAAQRIGAGDLNQRVPIDSHDEIGDLASRFNEMAAALQRDEQLRRTLMTDIAHELRTPLAVIRGQVEALQDGVFELTPEHIAPIHDQVLLLGRLVDDLRVLALAEAGRLPLEHALVSLDGLVRRVTDGFQAQALAKGLALSVDLPTDLPPVEGDSQRLEQVLANLLTNALRHTPAGGQIQVRAWSEGPGVNLSVADTGSGIEPADLPFVFDRFYRADAARSRVDGGSGLGLAITKQLVEAHGGRITVESMPGRGTIFVVWLPF